MNKTLLLVDGSSYLYRAFHAMPDLRNAKGEPTGAIYGVINMLRRLLADHKADFLGCIFDPKGKTFRDDIFPAYKANRAAMPDDMRVQIEPLYEAIRAMGWPLVVIDGVEADDVIGTLAKLAEREGAKTIVSTGDKDLAQLVNDHVTLVNTMSNETLDIAGVQTKFGVPPERIVDYLALIGDTVDNVPGVNKVGPKTAVKWLAEYGDLDGVIKNAADISGVVGENLRKALDWLPTGRVLVTVKTDVPLDFDTLQPHGCFIGSAAIIVLSQHDRARDAALNAMRFFEHESCGQCTPCRVGTAKAALAMAKPVVASPAAVALSMRSFAFVY